MKKLLCLILLGVLASPSLGQQTNQPTRRTVLPMLKDNSPAAYVRFGRPKITHGMAMRNPEGSTYQSDVLLGSGVVIPGEDSVDQSMYFQVATDQLVLATGTFYVAVQFFDRGQGAIDLEYMKYDGEEQAGMATSRFYLGNSGTWQRHTFVLNNTVLNNRFPGGTDFRIRCPGVGLRQVAISRVAFGDTQKTVSPVFNQPALTTPAGLQTAVFPDLSTTTSLWEDEALLDEKTKLYQAWGTSHVVDTVQFHDRFGGFDFSESAKRNDLLASRGLTWVPRIKVGDTRYLPRVVSQSLQKAVGTEHSSEGPVISLWERELIGVYATAFQEMNRYQLGSVPFLILSFAGDWGPLLLSSELQGASNWPDFWGGDPVAVRHFQHEIQKKYGTIFQINRAWNSSYRIINDILPTYNDSQSPLQNMDTIQWYQQSMIQLANQIVGAARQAFPRTKIVIELTDHYSNGATDLRDFSRLAARNSCSILLIVRNGNPTATPGWQQLAYQCQTQNVPFGLRIAGDRQELLGAFYALASEQGSLLFFEERVMAADFAWPVYRDSIRAMRRSVPRRSIAVIYPTTSLLADSSMGFQRHVEGLRERFAFDLVDERDVRSLSSNQYRMVICPWGHLWDGQAIQSMERLARAGSALIVSTEKPWQTLDGRVSFNEKLFAVELQKAGNGWVMQPARDQDQPFQEGQVDAVASRRVIDIGSPGSAMFLNGEWSVPYGSADARKMGLSLPSYRWIGSQAGLTMKMRPKREYTIQVQGFLPEGRSFDVFVNRSRADTIRGTGAFTWSTALRGSKRLQQTDLDILFRGDTWQTGEILDTTRTQRVGMAIHRVAVYPYGQQPPKEEDLRDSRFSPEFGRASLRSSWMREVGQGVTILAPKSYVDLWVFEEMLASIVATPQIMDTHFRFTQPADGERNMTFVSPLTGLAVYMNFSENPVFVKPAGEGARSFSVPPQTLHYVPYRGN